MMPRNWQWITLGEISDPDSRAIVSGPFGSNIGSRFFVEHGVPVIRGNNLTTDMRRFIDEGFVFVTEQKADELGNCEAVSDDLVFTAAGSLGQVGIIPRTAKYSRYIISNKQMRARIDRRRVDPLFAFYWFSSKQMVEYIQQRNTGSSVPLINLSVLRSLPIPLPPLREQRAIAHILGTLDDKIELNRHMNETLEAMARALFKSWFIDFDPVRAKAEGRDVGLPKHIAELFPGRLVDSEMGEIPEGWEVADFSQGIDFLEGPGLRNWQYTDIGMKFLNIRCIVDGDLDIARANCIRLNEFETTYSHFALKEDDIVISTSGTLGRLAIVRADHLPVMLNTSIIRMRGRGGMGLAYVWNFLQSMHFLDEMFALAAGSVQLNFGPMHLRKIKMNRPPDEVLCHFENAALPLIKRVLHNRQESRTLAALRDALLPKLISGELRLKDAERVVGGAL